MDFKKLYFRVGAIIGLLEVTDGALLMINDGTMNWFNLMVSFIELYWIPVCILMAVVFVRNKVSALSPGSYLIYQFTGLIILNTVTLPAEAAALDNIRFWLGLIGAVFGLYYLIINELMKKRA